MRSQHYVYGVNDCSIATLARFDKLLPYMGSRSDRMKHRYFHASNMIAIFHSARKTDLKFINRSQILSHEKCPEKTQQAENPLSLPLRRHPNRRQLIPDDIFALQFEEGVRFHAFETDLGTEAIRRKGKGTSFSDKLVGYIEVMEDGIHKDIWGIPKFSVLTVTASSLRMQNMKDEVKALTTHRPKLRDAFLFKVKSHLGARHWQEPPAMPDLLTDPWQTVNGPVFINKI